MSRKKILAALVIFITPILTLAQGSEPKPFTFDFAKPTRNFFLIGAGDIIVANGNGKVSGQTLITENLYIPPVITAVGGGVYGTVDYIVLGLSASALLSTAKEASSIPDGYIGIADGLVLDAVSGVSPLQIGDVRLYMAFGAVSSIYSTKRNKGAIISIIPNIGLSADYTYKLGKIDEKTSYAALIGLRATYGWHKIANTDAITQYSYTLGTGFCLRLFVGFGCVTN